MDYIKRLILYKLDSMKIFLLNKMGYLHDTHTEDHVFLQDIGNKWIIGAVMDGCSSGKETYFASTLYGKILGKTCRMLPYLDRINPEFSIESTDGAFIGKFLLNQVFDNLRKVHQLLATELIEMLATLILLVYHPETKAAWINISGDGFIVYDKQILEIDQNNVPDYMAYHLDIKFDHWIKSFSRTYTLDNQSDISISTDGISKFFSFSTGRQRTIDPVQYFLIDDTFKNTDNMLGEKFRILQEEHRLVPYDDLGIIRIINL